MMHTFGHFRFWTREAGFVAAFLVVAATLMGPPHEIAAQGLSGAVTVASVTPSSGAAAGGTTVTISGIGFLTGASVLFGLVPATNVTVTSTSQITATVPANSVATVAVPVTVVNTGGVSGTLSGAFTYGATTGQLNVSGIAPSNGSLNGGTTVTITGSGLSRVTSVSFGGVAGTGLSATGDSSLTVTTPAAWAGVVTVTVVTSDGSSTTMPNAFVYSTVAAITLTSISPAAGSTAGGTTTTLSGSGFATGITVSIGGAMATNVNVISASRATATAPARSTTGPADVRVTAPSGETATLTGGFVYQTVTATPVTLPATGIGLFVFGGGSNDQLVTATGCPKVTAAFWTTTASGEFVSYVPGTTIGPVNAAWNTLFPAGIPAGTALLGKCA